MLTVDVTANTNRWRPLHPAEKVVPGLALLAIALWRPVLPAAALVLLTTTLATVWGAKVPVRRWLRGLSWPAAFVLSGAVGVALVWGDGPGPLPLTATGVSLRAAATVVARSIAGISAILFIGMTTPMVDLLALFRAARVPAVVTDLMSMMYRLMFELMETGRRLRIAQASRLGHDGLIRSIRSTSLATSAVFVQSVQRSRRLQIGLDARGYHGELRVLSRREPLSRQRLVAGLAIAGLVHACSLVAGSFP